jgi:hypothetical protein
MLKFRQATAFFIFACSLPLCAQDSASSSTSAPTDVSALAQQVKALQDETKELRERIKVLEGAQPAVEPSPASEAQPIAQSVPAAQAPPPQELPSELHELRGIQWKGFGEADYKILNQNAPELGTYGFVPGSTGNFYSGDFDLFIHSQLSNSTSVLADLAFEETDAQQYKIDPRQILLMYNANEHLRLSFGRFQTSIGYYNRAFRSAAWLQTTADRPLVMEYASNGGILPTQGIGISATGAIPSGHIDLHYIAEYGSSDTMRPDLTGDGILNDENNGNFVNIGLYAEPDAVPGLRIGASFYHDQISDLLILTDSTMLLPANTPSTSTRFNQTVVNGHVVYISRGIEFLNEGFLIRHSVLGGHEVFNTSVFYSQISKKWGSIRPFARYQYANASAQNPIFDDLGLREGPSFGADYIFTNYITFKAQLDHTSRRNLPDLNGLHLQMAFVF